MRSRRPVRATAWLVALALLAALQAGCDRNVEPFDPDEQPRPPDLSRIFPEGGEGPGPGLGSGVARDGAQGPAGRRGAMPVAPAAPAAAGAAEAAPIRGRIEIDPALTAAAPSGATLFVIARRAGQAGGPPLAVRRFARAQLPLDFEIGPQHAMIQGMPFEGPIALSARLDADGDAMTRGPDDLSGAAPAPVEPGASGVRIVLSRRGGA